MGDVFESDKKYPNEINDKLKTLYSKYAGHNLEVLGTVPMSGNSVMIKFKIDGSTWTYEKFNDERFTLFTLPDSPPGPSRDYALVYRSYDHPGWYLSYSETGNDVRSFEELSRIFNEASSSRHQMKTEGK